MASWIKLHSGLLDWEWFEIPEMVQLFIYLLLKANTKRKTWKGITINRGQLVTSNARINADLGISPQTIRTCLKRLISTGEITYQSTNRYTLVTICKYDEYQDCKLVANEQINEPSNEQLTNNQRATNEQSTTTIDSKNIDSIKDTNLKETSLTRGKESGAAAATPTSASDEAKAPKPKTEKIPAKEIKEMWNTTCTSFPKLFTISENRKNKMRLRIEEMGGAEKALPLLKTVFEKMQASSFLKGENKRGWKASFDWLFENDKNWVKVWEGNYENRKGGTAPTKKSDNVNDIWK